MVNRYGAIRPELAGLEALRQEALKKNRMMNYEERERIGSLGKPKTFLDLYNEYQADQKANSGLIAP